MRLVFMGTPQFAATILEELAVHHEIACVYTRPDAVRGRGKELMPSPVKEVALACGIEVRTPKTLRDSDVQAEIAAWEPDVICVAAYGAIIPPEILRIPRLEIVNAHASLLPRWRGAAPVERAILAGDEETGVCIMRVEEGLDTGDFCVCRKVPIGSMNAVELSDELANIGAQAMLTALVHLEEGCAYWTPQNEEGMVYASKIEKGELFLNPQDSADLADRKVRASSEAHAARCSVGGKGITVLKAKTVSGEETLGIAPGQVFFQAKRLYLGCAEGALELLSVKPDGKGAMEAKAFAAGIQGIKAGGVTWEAC